MAFSALCLTKESWGWIDQDGSLMHEGLDLNCCLQQLLGGPWGERFTLHSDGEGSWEGKVDNL